MELRLALAMSAALNTERIVLQKKARKDVEDAVKGRGLLVERGPAVRTLRLTTTPTLQRPATGSFCAISRHAKTRNAGIPCSPKAGLKHEKFGQHYAGNV